MWAWRGTCWIHWSKGERRAICFWETVIANTGPCRKNLKVKKRKWFISAQHSLAPAHNEPNMDQRSFNFVVFTSIEEPNKFWNIMLYIKEAKILWDMKDILGHGHQVSLHGPSNLSDYNFANMSWEIFRKSVISLEIVVLLCTLAER